MLELGLIYATVRHHGRVLVELSAKRAESNGLMTRIRLRQRGKSERRLSMKKLQSLLFALLLLGALTTPAWADNDDHHGPGNGKGLALGRIFHRGEIVALALAS